MATQKNNLLPFRDYDPHEELNFFAMSQTGVAGTFVSFVANNPDSGNGYSNSPVGAQYANTLSVIYNVNSTVAPSASGDTKYKVAGVLTRDVRDTDEHGQSLRFLSQAERDRLQCVLTGQAVPILKRGLITLSSNAYLGTPQPGYVGVIDNSGGGIVRAVDPASLVTTPSGGAYTQAQVVGRFISSAGSALGGYAQFEVGV